MRRYTNDSSSSLQHSWGKKPEQKAREKEYNHEYYEAHKGKWGVEDASGRAKYERKESESINKRNRNITDFSDDVMKNVEAHNNTVSDNIDKVTKTVLDFIEAHPDMSPEAKKKLLAQLEEQVNKAHKEKIDINEDEGHSRVEDILEEGKKKKKQLKHDSMRGAYTVVYKDDYLAHSWGKKPEQKAREKEYNHWYYINKIKGKIDDAVDDVKEKTKDVKAAYDKAEFLADGRTKGMKYSYELNKKRQAQNAKQKAKRVAFDQLGKTRADNYNAGLAVKRAKKKVKAAVGRAAFNQEAWDRAADYNARLAGRRVKKKVKDAAKSAGDRFNAAYKAAGETLLREAGKASKNFDEAVSKAYRKATRKGRLKDAEKRAKKYNEKLAARRRKKTLQNRPVGRKKTYDTASSGVRKGRKARGGRVGIDYKR